MREWCERTSLLLGDDALTALSGMRVLVVGVGGVGAYAAEMVARAGIGHITIIDGDNVSVSNINRQLPALHSTVGIAKVEIMKQRISDISPDIDILALQSFITADSVPAIFTATHYDYVIDAIDAIAPKVALIEYCLRNKIKIIASMGAGGRTDPSAVQYADISKTYHDGLAKVVRTRLRERGINSGLKTVWSPEQPSKAALTLTSEIQNKRSSYGTVSYMPCIFGCMLAAHVIKKLTEPFVKQ